MLDVKKKKCFFFLFFFPPCCSDTILISVCSHLVKLILISVCNHLSEFRCVKWQGLFVHAQLAVPQIRSNTQLSSGSHLRAQAEQAQVCLYLPLCRDLEKKPEAPIFSLLLHCTRGNYSN